MGRSSNRASVLRTCGPSTRCRARGVVHVVTFKLAKISDLNESSEVSESSDASESAGVSRVSYLTVRCR